MISIGAILGLPDIQRFAKIERERAGISRALAVVTQRREAALLADASDKAIAKLDSELDRLHLALERLEVAERFNGTVPLLCGRQRFY